MRHGEEAVLLPRACGLAIRVEQRNDLRKNRLPLAFRFRWRTLPRSTVNAEIRGSFASVRRGLRQLRLIGDQGPLDRRMR